MKLTNKFGYPETIVKAIENDPYDKGDSEFSATGLIEPPRKRVLTEQHWNEIEEDVDDGVWRLFGQLGHVLLERAGTGLNNILERRFFGVVGGSRVSAQIDSLSLEPDGTLVDWKFTTVYGFKSGVKPKRDWIAQMNIQKFLVLKALNVEIKQMKIWGILRDWRPGEKKRSKDYPNKLGFHQIPMYSNEAAEKFIATRIEAHRAADKVLPECDDEDHWGWKRCSDGYCNVAKFCSQYQGYLNNKRSVRL